MKKQLLKESEIRKMMKFANIGALTNGFVDRINETYLEGGDEDLTEAEEEEEEEEEASALDLDMPTGAPETGEEEIPAPAADLAGLEGEEDFGAGAASPGGEAADTAVDGVEQLFNGLTSTFQAIANQGGEGAEVAQQVLDRISMSKVGDEAPTDEPAELPPAEGEELPPTADVAPPGLGGEEEEPLPDLEEADASMVEDEEVMNEVARRVAKRILNLKRSDKKTTRKRRRS